MERSTKRIGFIGTVGLGLLLLLQGCEDSHRITGLKTVEVPDSARYVQVERDQPYGLLWTNGKFNLWRRVDTHTTTYGYPPRDQKIEGSFVYGGTLESGQISGTVVDSKVDSGNFVGGEFFLQERWDTLEGRCTVRFLIPTGVYEDTLHLTMVRQ